MQYIAAGVVIILLGILCRVRPDMFKRLLWDRISINRKVFSEFGYEQYIRVASWGFIGGGLIICISGIIYLWWSAIQMIYGR